LPNIGRASALILWISSKLAPRSRASLIRVRMMLWVSASTLSMSMKVPVCTARAVARSDASTF